jgi:hypothetical protein
MKEIEEFKARMIEIRSGHMKTKCINTVRNNYKKRNMHIRDGHIQKTQHLHSIFTQPNK